MPRTASSAVENNFVNGWITEATGLNFPENAVVDSDNCIFQHNGQVDRRLGIDLENGSAPGTVITYPEALTSEYLWENAAGFAAKTFHLQQYGSLVVIYEVGGESISSTLKASFDFSTHSLTSLVNFRTSPFQFASGLGRLFISHPYMDPVYLTYNSGTDTFSANTITIQTRDTIGIPGPPRGRTGSLTDSERYDLYNQGWDANKVLRMYSVSGTYPSDYDVWWLYKTPDAFGNEVFLTDTAYAAGILNQVDRGNSPAPKGSFILNEFYQDRSNVSSLGGIPVVTSGSLRPATIAFHAGRVFYAGVQAPDYSSKVYFSQILESIDKVSRCYQENDPTSQYSSDLLPTDGGVIAIPEAGNIIKLWPMEGSLLVFCSNGIWQITGSQGIGFSANDYTVRKISKQEILSALSFVNVLGMPMWWSTDGIYAMTSDSVGALQVKSLSAQKIDSYLEDLSSIVKSFVKGAFNLKDRIVQWVYRETAGTTTTGNQTYTHVLNFDIQTSAFYKFTIPTTFAHVTGIFCVQGYGADPVNEEVTNNLSQLITTSGGESITVVTSIPVPVTALFKYTTLTGAIFDQLTFSELRDFTFTDWASVPLANGGTDAFAEFLSGFRLRGEAQRKFQSNYITFYSANDIPASYFVQARWDYATSGSTGRWSSRQKIDIGETDYQYARRRLKLRGHGLVLQYNVQSVPLRPLSLIGWSAWDTTNGSL